MFFVLLFVGVVEFNGVKKNVLISVLGVLFVVWVLYVEMGLRRFESMGVGWLVGYFGMLGVMGFLVGYVGFLVKDYWGF